VADAAARRSDGSTGICSVVDSPDIALIVPADGERLHLVEQYRYPVGGRPWEFPAGSLDQGADAEPATAAARELREETGLAAGTMTLLGRLAITPSTFSQRCWAFLAVDLTQGPTEREPEEQDMRSAWFTRAEI
jgi:8-oxo-dGTP pyrophosphatase MutT (NUDIX family)